jgi:hypothetical protein
MTDNKTQNKIQDEDNDKLAGKHMSQTEAAYAEDVASESEVVTDDDDDVQDFGDKILSKQDTSGDDSPGSDDINTEQAPYQHPANQGEQSVSGDNPDPSSDDDTLQNAHMMGEQLDEDDEHLEELDIARDFDDAERHIRSH